jgi:hypothetical protein
MRVLQVLAVVTASGTACVGTTGGQLVDFQAAAAGPADANAGQPFAFTTDRGWHVVLTTATLHVGALYLDQSAPVSGSQGTNCILPATYVAQVIPPLSSTGIDVDLLSSTPQPFPASGQGTTLPPALLGQVWLTGGDINATEDTTPILVLAGTADQDGTTIPFEGKITIGSNREAGGSALAGADPICKQRIVSIPTAVSVRSTGALLLRIDPRLLFVNVDLSQLTKFSSTYGFSDDPTSPDYTQPSLNLYQDLHSAGALYTFSWVDGL